VCVALWLLLSSLFAAADAAGAGDGPILAVPASPSTLYITAPLPKGLESATDATWQLVEVGGSGKPIAVDVIPGSTADGSLDDGAGQLIAAIPARTDSSKARRFRLAPSAQGAAPLFRFADIDGKSLGLWEGERPVLAYNHGMMSKPGVPADRTRSSYVHPIYGPEGEVLTDDFPADHYHHRGMFWAWPHIRIGGKEYNLWMFRDIQQRFERWLVRRAGRAAAVLAIESGWYIGEKKVMQERVWLRTHAASAGERVIDVALTWTAIGEPVTLWGAEGKSYGGFNFRYAPRTETVITTPGGRQPERLNLVRLPWADLTARFSGAKGPTGVAVFVDPSHPDYQPMWITRPYGFLGVGWPGIKPATLQPDKPVCCRYRVWIHRGSVDVPALERVQRSYTLRDKVTWESSAE